MKENDHKESTSDEANDEVGQRIQCYVDKLPDILESFEESHPDWRSGVMISFQHG